MTRYQPGDVAMISALNRPTPYRAFFDGTTWRGCGKDSYFCVDTPTDYRPVVVIDPEDSGQVERLWLALRDGLGLRSRDNLTAALRSLIAPPKPEEPTGLGAVVEDAEGDKWVRSHEHYPHAPWTRPHLSGVYEYAQINAVRVLSEGWSE